ncbi:hypothetical protein [Bacillus sp. FJAT-28004]|uniref:hypothetical protein n=1 Tax=Bacillus sp. FJAT-28004 TaxID=1679165 RepID=UPI0006B4ED8F|nr:hypothetical protein [Bacillus sp. FJAT-28004]
MFHRQDLKDFRSSPLGLDRQTIPDIRGGSTLFHLIEDWIYPFTNSKGIIGLDEKQIGIEAEER